MSREKNIEKNVSRKISAQMNRVVLIPAAGQGIRVGRPESKEMLPRPQSAHLPGEPLIALALKLAKENRAHAHVLLRQEKVGLCRYLESWPNYQVTVQKVSLTHEWPDTLLASKNHWGEFNVVVLPDSDFAPLHIVSDLFRGLELGSDTVFATFAAEDLHSWGAVKGGEGFLHEGSVFRHCEKPMGQFTGAKAWGLFGFRREFGEVLLNQMLKSTFDHRWRDVPGRTACINLDYYMDLTR